MFVEAGGFLLNAVHMGQGSRVFVAHGGWAGNWELWQEPFLLMQSHWRCISYDHRGTGASTAPPDSIDAESLVADLFAVLDHFEVARCVLAGESLGGLTCVLAALAQPERFEGLVLVDAVTATPDFGEQTAIRLSYPEYVSRFIAACVPEQDCDHIARWGGQILLRAEPEAAARMYEAQSSITADLAGISVPTLVIHGDRDAIVPVSAARYAAAAIPDAELVVLPGAGHVPTMTRPSEVVEAIDGWAARRLLYDRRAAPQDP